MKLLIDINLGVVILIQFQRYISTIDAHTAGEPLRIITSGFPMIEGNTILEKRDYVLKNYDHLRKNLMLEPRGHSGMYGCILTPAVTNDGDFGVLFMHNEGLSTMCGHGIIAVTKIALEIGMIEASEGDNTIRIDSPAGRVTALASVSQGKVCNVRFENVPSFVYARNVIIDIDGVGEISIDIVFSGAFYAVIDVDKVGVDLSLSKVEKLVELGMKIKYRVMDCEQVVHPLETGLKDIYGTIIKRNISEDRDNFVTKNVTIFADGQIDRSPCGTGTAAIITLLYDQGKIGLDSILTNNSIIDTKFTAYIANKTSISSYKGVIPVVRGTAHIMGFNQLVLDPEDPLPDGFHLIGG